jgi:phage tail-like protein
MAIRVVAAQATMARCVRVSFDGPVRQTGDGAPGDALRPESYRFEAITAPAVKVVPFAVQAAGASAVDVALDIELSPRATYRVIAAGIVGADGVAGSGAHNHASFAGFMPPGRPGARAFELIRMLPELNRQMDQTGDLRKFMAVLQDVLELLLSDIDRFADIFDLDRAPEPFLDCMLEDLGNPFAFDLGELQKRRLLSVLVEIYKQKGTAAGIRNAVRFFLGVDVTSVDAFHGTTLVLGESRLGVDWVLGPSDSFARYAFDITVSRQLADSERQQIRQIVDFMRPAHTHFIDIIEPGAPTFIDHWELGLSKLGENTELH